MSIKTSHKKFSKRKQMHVARDGRPTKLDENDTTLSHHPYILCDFPATYTKMLCVCCGRQWGE